MEKVKILADHIIEEIDISEIQICTKGLEEIWIVTWWKSKNSLTNFMKYRFQQLSQIIEISKHYETIEVDSLDVTSIKKNENDERKKIIEVCEAYRISITMYIALRNDLFTCLSERKHRVEELASRLNINKDMLRKLLNICVSLNFITFENGEYGNGPVAEKYFVHSSQEFLGYVVLHYCQPFLFKHWLNLSRRFKQSQDSTNDQFRIEDSHEMFLRANHSIALAGQTKILTDILQLDNYNQLMDLGGALGANSIALCRKYPLLKAIIVDREETKNLAEEMILRSGVSSRIEFRVGDYRDSDSYDDLSEVILMSNILRAETLTNVKRMLDIAYSKLKNNGLLILADLFPDSNKIYPLSASLFSLHILEGSNCSINEMIVYLKAAGFRKYEIKYLEPVFLLNAVILAWKN